MTSYPDLQGQTAIVTGASRGIGLAIAKTFVANGMRVCITARNDENLQEAVRTMPEGTAIGIAGKADDPNHRVDVMDRVAQEFGRLDVLVNNAGINPVYGPLKDLDLAAAEKVFSVNIISTLAWVQEALHNPRLKFQENHGRVVNLSSVTSEMPGAGIGLYGISKAGVSHLTRTLAAELGPDIRVNAISPALIKTEFAKALYEGREQEVTEQYPLKSLGKPDDVAAAAAFLCSAASSWVTGHILTVDGGLSVAGGSLS
ncbi:MAG TPA: SDR family oxidoreductase [Candidatus Yaniella excrementigallinarum]|nr:SDR family oxidoreductase [Candidatus Yaniella excrementigallinarum]